MARPCELYLVRHAIAADRGEDWPDDDKRPLTQRGVARFKEAVEGSNKLDDGIDEIFTSPLIRAQDRRPILLAAGLPGKASVKVLDALAPGHTPSSVMAQLARNARRRRIALVGHEPALGELAAHLIGAGGRCRSRRAASAALTSKASPRDVRAR